MFPRGCRYKDRTLHDLVTAVNNEAEVLVTGLVRAGLREEMPSAMISCGSRIFSR